MPGDEIVEGDSERDAGVLAASRGDFERAHAHHARALALYQRAYGDQDERVAAALSSVGDALLHLRRLEPAFAALEQALAIRRELYGDDHLDFATSQCVLGIAEVRNGRAEHGGPRIAQALAIRKAKLPEGHPAIAEAHGYLALALHVDDLPDEAVVEYETAIRMFVALGMRQEEATQEHHLGILWSQCGDLPQAVEHLERADRAWQAVNPNHTEAGDTRFILGQLLWAAGQEARALELVATLRAPGRNVVDRWLSERGR